MIVLALLSVPVSLLRNLPHQLAYFNEFAGGRLGGHKHLLHSNIDWNQDLLFLKEWMEQHPEARPLRIIGARMYAPEHLGLDCVPRSAPQSDENFLGWLAVSVNDVFKDKPIGKVEIGPSRASPLSEQLKNRQPIARVANSYLIYQIPVP